MTSAEVKPLRPERVKYLGHEIVLTYRPKINDWTYRVQHTTTITLTGMASRYDEALRLAKRDVDILEGTTRGKR